MICADIAQLQELVAIAAASLAGEVANEDKEIVLDELEIFKVRNMQFVLGFVALSPNEFLGKRGANWSSALESAPP